MKNRIITAVFVLIWMFVIFSFSGQEGEQSASLSGHIAEHIVRLEQHVTGVQYTAEHHQQRVSFWQFPVRKTAHGTVYFVLGVLLFVHLGTYKVHQRKLSLDRRFTWSWLVLILFAISDEIHQLYVPDRVGSPMDVAIDAFGGLLGLLLCLWLYQKHQNKKMQSAKGEGACQNYQK